MILRHKFGSLALLYVVSLIVNVVLCAWCIVAYHHSILQSLGAGRAAVDEAVVVGTDSRAGPALPEASARAEVPEPADEPGSDILRILFLNALCGLALALLGLRLVRRWVARPVAGLREAADQIGRGNFSYRAPVTSSDELGLLAAEVNTMAETVVTMQSQLVEQERRLVGAQALRCVVHNIRSPLTGIRWLAEAVTMRRDVDGHARDAQNRIVAIVDGILEWLERFRNSLAASSLQVAPVSISGVLRQVASSLDAFARQHGVEIRIESSDAPAFRLDLSQITPAMEALLRSTITCCTSGQSVYIMARNGGSRPGAWQVVIGCGDPRDSSAVTTETGTASPPLRDQAEAGDLKMAQRAIQMHGGHLETHSDRGRCRFVITLPEWEGAGQHG